MKKERIFLDTVFVQEMGSEMGSSLLLTLSPQITQITRIKSYADVKIEDRG